MNQEMPSGAVTFLFTDIERSTQLWERDPALMREALSSHDGIVRASIEAHNGTVFHTGGDGFGAAFPDPVEALVAAMSAQRSLAETEWVTEEPIRVRMGLHTGTAQLRDGDYFGPTLNRTARLTDAGHGGQVLLSEATYRLVVDAPPENIELLSMGTHHLKGLDRPEEVFQVRAPGLAADFEALRTTSANSPDPAVAAEAAFQAKRWQEAVDLLDKIESEAPLSAAQQLNYAYSLWWLGKHDDLARRFESAYNAATEADDLENAAMAAVELAEFHHHGLSHDVSRSWERKAESLLETATDSIALGYLLRWQTVRAFEIEGDPEKALSLSKKAMEVAKAHDEGSLEALSLQDQGRILVAMGRPDDGMPLMDEAMLAAVAGDVNPLVVGRSYCNMLAVCEKTGDISRASEWSAAAQQWCEQNEQAPYPGVCRIFKAEIMWRKGDWVGAESEVLRASNELGVLTDVAGEAFYQYGEMRLRAGDEEGAERAFQEALARGRQPVPGYALLLAGRGDVSSAVEILQRTLADIPEGRLDRAQFLPAYVDLLIENDRFDDAVEAAEELSEIGEVSHSELFKARSMHAKGRIDLARGDIGSATARLKGALQTLTRLGLPFEAALAHADLGIAYRSDGVEALAQMELKVAASELKRLGAGADRTRVEALLGEGGS